MFLTNNYRTIDNLMIYSRGKYIPRIIITNRNGQYSRLWVEELQINWDRFLKMKTLHTEIDFTVEPYGIVGHRLHLELDANGKPILYNGKEIYVFNK